MGTATGTASQAWLTLDDGELTEVYAPDLGTPSVRDLQFVVTDGRSFAEREREDAIHTTTLADPRSLTYRQVNTARSGRWRITKTYVTDPDRVGGAGGRQLRVAHRAPLQALRAARSRAVEQRRRRHRRDGWAARWSPVTSISPRRWPPSPPRRGCRAATWERATAGPTCATTSGWTGPMRGAPANGNVVQIAELPLTGEHGHRTPRSRSGSAPPRRPPRARPAPRSPAASSGPPTATPRAGTRTSAG